jgi:hypothetical protein
VLSTVEGLEIGTAAFKPYVVPIAIGVVMGLFAPVTTGYVPRRRAVRAGCTSALLITNPKALDNPFYRLAPDWALYPLVVLATAATVIASQATISGTYSLTKQAIPLDYLRCGASACSPQWRVTRAPLAISSTSRLVRSSSSVLTSRFDR